MERATGKPAEATASAAPATPQDAATSEEAAAHITAAPSTAVQEAPPEVWPSAIDCATLPFAVATSTLSTTPGTAI